MPLGKSVYAAITAFVNSEKQPTSLEAPTRWVWLSEGKDAALTFRGVKIWQPSKAMSLRFAQNVSSTANWVWETLGWKVTCIPWLVTFQVYHVCGCRELTGEAHSGVHPRVICPQKPFLQGAFLWRWALSGMSALLRRVILLKYPIR